MKPLETEFAGIQFKNPVVLASGTCGFGKELNEYFDIEKLGGISSKGLTLDPQSGNEGIRIYETPSGIMNSIGLENPGIEAFLKDDYPWLHSLDLVNIINLGGHSIEEYEKGAALLNEADIDMLELNISCPNVKEGGMNFGIKTEKAREVIKAVRRITKHKLVVKLSPNAEDIVSLAKMCEEEGADGLTVANTYLAMAVDISRRKAVFNNTYAGLSGPAIKPVSLRLVHQVSHAVKIPVMGCGGITAWQDAVEYIMAGASLVQVGTATFMNPMQSLKIVEGLENYCIENHLDRISDIRGCID